MNPTELAHWRYRVKALTTDLEQALRCPWGRSLEEAKYDVDLMRWLLEEARYMCELGAIQSERRKVALNEMTRDSTEEVGALLKSSPIGPEDKIRVQTGVGLPRATESQRKTKTINTDFGDEVFWDDSPANAPSTMQGDAGPEYYKYQYLLKLVKWVAEEVHPGLLGEYSPTDVESMLREFIDEHGRFPR